MDGEIYYNRGVAYHKKGLFDEAIADYTRAIEINPEDAEAYHNRGVQRRESMSTRER